MYSLERDGYRNGIYTEIQIRSWLLEFQSSGERKKGGMTTTNKFVSRLLLLAWKTVFISCAKCERETWQKVGIICTGCDFTFFWVFQVSFWNVDLISDLFACVGHVMSTFSQAEAMIFLLHLLFSFFSPFKNTVFKELSPPPPPTPNTHTQIKQAHAKVENVFFLPHSSYMGCT